MKEQVKIKRRHALKRIISAPVVVFFAPDILLQSISEAPEKKRYKESPSEDVKYNDEETGGCVSVYYSSREWNGGR